ncbi:hypothetical protein FUAX_22770 [Fulvitalea axinellae]|uniref:Uncharacterized protein n=1 Tax=Fulvitalea axinellae TaxID=1182444 RepID=A0AAU9CKL4_9BACT|nr:hypothetical protein FUAX_22770 [Fulvitalea axinellae]
MALNLPDLHKEILLCEITRKFRLEITFFIRKCRLNHLLFFFFNKPGVFPVSISVL